MDLSRERVEQSQVTPPHDDCIHDDFGNDIRESRSDSCFGVIEGGGCDMVIEIGLESGGSVVVENLGDSSDIDVGNGFDEPDDDDFFAERRDFGPEFRDIASLGSNIRLITVESGSDDEELENEREIWGIDLDEEDVYVNDDDDDDDDDDVSVTIPLCWDSLQLEDRGVTIADEFDWEEVDDGVGDVVGEEIELRSGFAEVDFNDESSVSVSVSPIISLEDLPTRERAEGNRGWEVLLNHTLEINFDVENRELYIVGDHDDQTTEYEMLFEQFADAEVSVLGLPPTSKSFLKNLPMVRLDGESNDDGVVVCAVCKDEMNIGNEAVQLPCNHKYHSECIVPWLKVRNTCPVCRHELPTDDAEYEQRKIQRTTSTFNLVL
ncbi:PREDICTED: E3 ubiquitin-protein ligase CIP8-like isoform X1 [Camelina sativa]|uniref:RING-type E3 ubiquitin transferase n=2 Tax=Camelina sativa TaxID=90675 RepID=A0ABM0TA25_CAMSA|nr:PREDICTED: E3 ubiquitin-protein ligase CIP8-like isoform X1 [Camelina sativa]